VRQWLENHDITTLPISVGELDGKLKQDPNLNVTARIAIKASLDRAGFLAV
jgi:hypothetical protein